MDEFKSMQALVKVHGTLARVVNTLWELGWPEDENDLLWDVRRSLALLNDALDGPQLSEEERNQLIGAIEAHLTSAETMSAVAEGNALLSRLKAPAA